LGLTGKPLLDRNVLPTGSTIPVGNNVGLVTTTLVTSNPNDESFIVPAWIKTPMDLVEYYMSRLGRRYDKSGKAWSPPLGPNKVIYVRAAKTLINELGVEKAVRFVADSVAAAYHPPSMQWIVKRLNKIKTGDYRCPLIPDQEKQSTLLL